ncbi:MAG: aminotransferase class I/II-fold pyridoxal phosphate-dependent enzyme [Candidatus Geothermarchaeales archaeon]
MSPKIRVAKRVRGLHYAIRDVLDRARKVEEGGKKVLYLNIGDPVKYDFDTPDHIKNALNKASRDGYNWYAPSEGLPELREAICEKESKINQVEIQPDDVIVTDGVSEAIRFVIATLMEPGGEILLPGPTYPPYDSYVRFLGGSPVAYKTLEVEGWSPDLTDLRDKITDKTRAILLINPNNPTGAVYGEGVVRQVLDVAGEYHLPVISDEIYDQIIYGKVFKSTASLSKDVPVVGLNGFSKCYLMTGWRLGYVYLKSESESLVDVREGILKLARIRLSVTNPVQHAGVAALRGGERHIRKMVRKLRARRDLCVKRLSRISGLSCTQPKGAFYLFPEIEGVGSRWSDDEAFAYQLLEDTGILVVPGSGFGAKGGSGHVRLVFLPPEELLEEALQKFASFMEAT